MKWGWLRSSLCVVLSVVLVTVGCAGPMAGSGPLFERPGRAALICGAGGAAAGAAVGAAAGGAARRDWKGALVGAAIGALVGGVLAATACFAIAEHRSQQVKTYEETRQALRYEPSQGDAVQVTHYAITPAAASPGTEVAFSATYHVMTPNPEQEVQVTETRIVQVQDPRTGQYRELGKVATPVTAKPGTRQADGKFGIRSGVAEGSYRVIFEVAKNGLGDGKQLPLIVTKNQAVLGAPANRIAQAVSEGTKAAEPTVAEPAKTEPSTQARAATDPAVTPQPAQGGSLAALGEQQPKAPSIAVATPAPAETKTLYFVASRVVGRGNVREGPGTKLKIIGEIRLAERFLIVERVTPEGETDAWYKIRLEDGREGWVASSLGEEVRE